MKLDINYLAMNFEDTNWPKKNVYEQAQADDGQFPLAQLEMHHLSKVGFPAHKLMARQPEPEVGFTDDVITVSVVVGTGVVVVVVVGFAVTGGGRVSVGLVITIGLGVFGGSDVCTWGREVVLEMIVTSAHP